MFEFITALIARSGAMGVFLLMLVENIFPPLPSELILPFAGYVTAHGRMTLIEAVLAGTAGSVLGAWVWYELGRRLGEERLIAWAGQHGRWLTVTPNELRRALQWTRRHGGLALLVGRMLPGVRGVICVPAGFAGLSRFAFLLWCTLGSFGWSLLLCAAGRLLAERYTLIERWTSPALTVTFILAAAIYAYRVVTFRRREPTA